MMDMTENPKLDLASCCGDLVSEEKTSTQKISVLDHTNGFHYTTDQSDSFVINMESFSHGGFNKDVNPNSRITKILSRKGSQRGDKKTIVPNHTNSNDMDSLVSTSSPRGSCMPEKPRTVVAGSTDPATNQQVHHQIAITTGNITAATESRFSLRRNSFRRYPPPWLLDPKRILMLFATLSSMGTILLIYFTLSIRKMNGDENGLD
ncbi:hypothetical protein ERO13_D06G151500v2 [Gossypium hirsutum]|uniref:Uncharacterized protein isoform X1 n=9 Tax=Gossypium TaxID=3633 RepID=A0A1U8J5W0_GOSHI|nr:uncharacterized protein LOC107901927 isoform X1 [Gossypium hirsutum]KAB2025870.1 hypothetical protein ES319_D06G178700v1 [Gossypium barbadense]TYG65501.1 hypothetical protein ES288_D06G190600v1 [Gossypium darwinii]TYH67524.1 hypothetical protein ES332_D06G193300v1 [Gossypium tomentosum]TYI77987.1 hypothetical protein E1A91_D06G179300v1 [Gossypium mustelinum]KAG4142837.1 hypothetical protein ERO13_D06G151500v2 [Gossypium hirsutum]